MSKLWAELRYADNETLAGLAAHCLHLSGLEHREARLISHGTSRHHGQEEVLDDGSCLALVRVRTGWPYPMLVVWSDVKRVSILDWTVKTSCLYSSGPPRLWLHIFLEFVDHEVDECEQSVCVASHPFWLAPSRTQHQYNYALAYSSKGIL